MLSNLLTVTGQVGTLFLMMGVGFALAKLGKLTEQARGQLSYLLLYIVCPCVMVDCFQVERTPDLVREVALGAALATVCYVVYLLIALFFFRRDLQLRLKRALNIGAEKAPAKAFAVEIGLQPFVRVLKSVPLEHIAFKVHARILNGLCILQERRGLGLYARAKRRHKLRIRGIYPNAVAVARGLNFKIKAEAFAYRFAPVLKAKPRMVAIGQLIRAEARVPVQSGHNAHKICIEQRVYIKRRLAQLHGKRAHRIAHAVVIALPVRVHKGLFVIELQLHQKAVSIRRKARKGR